MLIEPWIGGFALLAATGALCCDGFAGACRSADNTANFRRAIPFVCVAVILALLTKIGCNSNTTNCPQLIAVEIISLGAGTIAVIFRFIGTSHERIQTQEKPDYNDPWTTERYARVARDLRMFSTFVAGFVLICLLLRIR